MSHVNTIKDLETELSFIKNKTLLVTCRTLDNGYQLVFRKEKSTYGPIEDLIFIHEDGTNNFKEEGN